MADKKDEKIPLAQAFFVVFYTIWGLFEIASIPVAR